MADEDDLVAQARRESKSLDNREDAWCFYDTMDLLERLAAEIERLRAWKESAMAVEAEWDAQAVARLLGIPLGAAIRASIQPAIERLRASLSRAEEERNEAAIVRDVMVAWAVEFLASEGGATHAEAAEAVGRIIRNNRPMLLEIRAKKAAREADLAGDGSLETKDV